MPLRPARPVGQSVPRQPHSAQVQSRASQDLPRRSTDSCSSLARVRPSARAARLTAPPPLPSVDGERALLTNWRSGAIHLPNPKPLRVVDLREIACPADDDEDDRGLWFSHWNDQQMSTWLRMQSSTPDDQRLLMLKMIAKGPLPSASISCIKEQLGLDSDDD